MATTTLTFFRPSTVRASASSPRKPDPGNRKRASSNWWAPLLGWSSDPDYINPTTNSSSMMGEATESETESIRPRPRSKFALGCFTEEKAKQLRMKTVETSTFHDIMYHSEIASRLASDVSKREEK